MPRGPLSAAAKARISRAQKRRWAKQRQAQAASPAPRQVAARNGDVRIPRELAELLAAYPSDYADPAQYTHAQTLALDFLRFLIRTEVAE
jgi:hypothetical protein